jgi:hypothetical protein
MANKWAGSPLTVSEASCIPDDEEAKVLIMPRTIPGMGLEPPLRFPLRYMYWGPIGWIPYLAIVILSESEQKMPFLASDLEAYPAPLLAMARDSDRGKRP